MKVIEEIRLQNLKALVDEAGGITRFAELAGKQQAQISQLLNQSPDSKTGKPKAVGSRQAREFEVAAGRPTGWMDHDHGVTSVHLPPLTPRQEAVLGLFDGLTESQQSDVIRELQETKQQNDELLTELLRRKQG